MERIKERVMWGTTAIHKLGDISREQGAFCHIYGEDKDNYYGCWCEGFGFIDVKYPKDTIRELTPEEAQKQAQAVYVIT